MTYIWCQGFSFRLLNLYLVILSAPSAFQIISPPTRCHKMCAKDQQNRSMTQTDVMCFGKFKALTNYSKVSKHTHVKHLFVGAWNLSGGLSCLKTSIFTMLQSSPSLSQRSVRRLSQSFTTLPPPSVPRECSLKHKQTVLFSPPGLFATFISDKVTGKRLDLTQCLHSSVSKLQYTLPQKLLCFSSSGRNLMWGMLLMMLQKLSDTACPSGITL